MQLLQHLYEKNNIQYSKDMTDAIPEEYMKEIKKNVRDGAANPKLQWSNALELVHKAYKVANVQRPLPNMKNAWNQYEEMIQFAVGELARTRGMDGDWRMSSSVFMESKNLQKIRVNVFRGSDKKSFVVETAHPDKLTSKICTEVLNDYDIEQKEGDGQVILEPRKFGIKQPFGVVIEYLNR